MTYFQGMSLTFFENLVHFDTYLINRLLISYSVTVSFGRGDGIFVSPLFEQSTTTPDDEHEHSAGQSLVPLPAFTYILDWKLAKHIKTILIKTTLDSTAQSNFGLFFIVKFLDLLRMQRSI